MNNRDQSGRSLGREVDADPAEGSTADYQHLAHLNLLLRDMVQIILSQADFGAVVGHFLALAKPLLPVVNLEFYLLMEPGKPLHLAPETGFRGTRADPPEACRALLGLHRLSWQAHGGAQTALRIPCPARSGEPPGVPGLVWPLFAPPHDQARALVILHLAEEVVLDASLMAVLNQLSWPLGVAVEREALFWILDAERQQTYERSIRDTLTGLYTPYYMQEAILRLCQVHNRDPNATIVVAAFDVDCFKAINERYGHAQGDVVLRQVARILMDSSRSVDLPVRLGGDAFMLFIIGAPRTVALHITERIRLRVSQQVLAVPMQEETVTISGGVAFRAVQEPIAQAMERADLALYQAKKGGRNRVVIGS
ncbi:MAG: GGDEF domain-containing protein [Magnetococcales bacterium]|nr:GGDEF domain-containing protein [Magnetococcales bacterium]